MTFVTVRLQHNPRDQRKLRFYKNGMQRQSRAELFSSVIPKLPECNIGIDRVDNPTL